MSAHPTLLSRYRVIAILAIVAMCLATIASPQLRTNVASADPTSVWGAGTLTDQNLWDLMAQMTVAEKNTFIHGS